MDFKRDLYLWLLLTVIVLAACAPADQPPDIGTAGFAPQLRDQPTQPAPAWIEGVEPVTLENAPRIAYIGRLDTANVPSTVFAHAFSPDATRLAGLNNEQLIAWDLLTGQIIFNTARGTALRVFYAPDKTEIYAVNPEGQIVIHNADTGAVKEVLEAIPQYAVSAYDADNGWLALGGLDGMVKVWDPAARQSLVTYETGVGQVTALAFSPDGQQLAVATIANAVQLWDWRSREIAFTLAGAALKLVYSPDGALLAVGEGERITLWNTAAGTLTHTLTTGPGGVSDLLAFSPDGVFLLNGGAIPALTVWDTATGRLVNTLTGVGGDRVSAVFSRDGDLLATSLLGGGVSLWDMTKIRQETLNRADLDVGTRQIVFSDWSGDGHLLTLFDATGPVRIWGIPPPQAG